mmetsp:Transcript_37713/g.106568  ORF Transcript_37713/g.106568 Transcript_37713/m.106568 type:complete len:206 (-) Transcript_37713:14-631(-)
MARQRKPCRLLPLSGMQGSYMSHAEWANVWLCESSMRSSLFMQISVSPPLLSNCSYLCSCTLVFCVGIQGALKPGATEAARCSGCIKWPEKIHVRTAKLQFNEIHSVTTIIIPTTPTSFRGSDCQKSAPCPMIQERKELPPLGGNQEGYYGHPPCLHLQGIQLAPPSSGASYSGCEARVAEHIANTRACTPDLGPQNGQALGPEG